MAWILFLLLILFLLFLDLGLFHKKDQVVTTKASLLWTLVWVGIASLFGIALFFIYDLNLYGINDAGTKPMDAVMLYFTGFVIEKSLSLDNIFIIAVIFGYFKIEPKFQHNILFWGILGAIIFRGIMIGLGVSFVQNFHWSTYIFGAILIYSALKMISGNEDDEDFSKNPALKFLSKFYPINWTVQNGNYFIKENGKRVATISLAALVVIEFTDILFAVDSIPAIFAITTDPFIVFTSNIFAILGLRNLYFFLANMLDMFKYMKYSLVFVLIFVGVKIGISNHYKFDTVVSLSFIMVALLVGVLASLMKKEDRPNFSKE